jgi:RNA polymerase sigma-70 factor (ECF subfamily)
MSLTVTANLPSFSADQGLPHEATDEMLARCAARGDRAALDQLVRRWQVPLLRFLQRHLPSRWDAEDVLQQVFLQVYQNLTRFDPQQRFRTWIFTIAYRAAVSHGRRPRLPNADPAMTIATPDAAVGPSAAAERSEQRQRLWDLAREHLSPSQYTALWLYYVEQLPAPQIARVMDSSWIAVKTTLHRARRKLLPHLATENSL